MCFIKPVFKEFLGNLINGHVKKFPEKQPERRFSTHGKKWMCIRDNRNVVPTDFGYPNEWYFVNKLKFQQF